MQEQFSVYVPGIAKDRTLEMQAGECSCNAAIRDIHVSQSNFQCMRQ
jgi:hypothetical protein